MIRYAEFSPDGKFRYSLERYWCGSSEKVRTLTAVMLNPSLANEYRDDPTTLRMVRFAAQFGYNRYIAVNCFALIGTDPGVLRTTDVDPVGQDNDYWIKRAAKEADMLVVAWGNDGDLYSREEEVLQLLSAEDFKLWCFGENKNGSPRFPLYLSRSTQLRRYRSNG